LDNTRLDNTCPTIGSSSVLALVSLLEKYGFEQEKISRLSSVDLDVLDHQDSRLPLDQYQRLWSTALKLTNNPALGLELGKVIDTANVGLVGHVVANSQNLAEGLDEYVRLFSIVNEAISLTLETDDNNAYLRFIHLNPEYYCIPDMERTMALFVYRGRVIFDQNPLLVAADFQHAQPSHIQHYKQTFDCPLNFNQHYCQIVFDRKFLEASPKQRNPFLVGATKQYANKLLAKILRRSVADKVRVLITQAVSEGSADVDHIAEQLNTSRQTLYRKLKAEGVSFQELLEEVRFTSAKEQLKDSSSSLSEIAFSLGFSDLSAFSRAFKRWSGMTPKGYRESMKNQASPKP